MSVATLKRTRAKLKGARVKRELSPDLLWERPADWPQLPEVLASDHKFVGLYKVEDHDMNHLSFTMGVPSGTWDVDWGDGTSDIGITGTASHTYSYSDTDLTGPTSEGFKVAIVVISLNTATLFNNFNMTVKNSNYGSNTNTSSGWLEMRMSFPGVTNNANFTLGNGSNIVHRNCRNFEYIGALGFSNATNMFVGFSSLEQLKVSRSWSSGITNFSSTFSGCGRLKYFPDLDLSVVTNASSMFGSCTQLRRVPELNMPVVTAINNMFQNCSSIEYIPDMTTGTLTAVSSAFSGCSSLKRAPALSSTASVTSTSNMFLNCTMLMYVPTYNMTAVTVVTGMFQGCTNLETIPALNLAAVSSSANFNNFLTSTHSLRKILATGARFTHTVYGQLSGAALDVYYTNLGTASSQTLTVSGNAVASDTPSIATAKGWTVSGS